MGNDKAFKDLLKKASGGTESKKKSAGGAEAELDLDGQADEKDEEGSGELVALCTEMVESIEVEAVVGGVLQRVRFREHTNPAQIGAMLRALDQGVKVRDDFPRKSFGNRETKSARVIVINARVTDSGKFVEMVSQNGEDLSVSVPRKKADDFLNLVKALNKVSEKNLTKLEAAFEDKKQATIILGDDEQFGVKYWMTDDGKAFMEDLVAEPPAATEDNNEGKDKSDE